MTPNGNHGIVIRMATYTYVNTVIMYITDA